MQLRHTITQIINAGKGSCDSFTNNRITGFLTQAFDIFQSQADN